MAITGIDGYDSNRYHTERYIFANGINQGAFYDGPFTFDARYPYDRALGVFNSGFTGRYWEIGPDAASQIWSVHTGNGTRGPGNAVSEMVVGSHLRNYHTLGAIPTEVYEIETLSASFYDSLALPSPITRRRLIIIPKKDGKFRLYSGPVTNQETQVLATSPDPILSIGEWAFIEVKFIHVSTTSARIIVRKDGVEVWQSPTVTVQPGSGFTQVGQAHNSFGFRGYMRDNQYISTGEFLGPVRIFPTNPRFTRRADWAFFGSGVTVNHQAIDEFESGTNPDKADYVESSSAGATDLYQMRHYPSYGSIKAVQLNVWAGCVSPLGSHSAVRLAARSSGGAMFYSPPMRIPRNYQGNSNFAGGFDATFPYVNIFHVWEVNPETGKEWNGDQFLDWQFGYELAANVPTRIIQMSAETMFELEIGAFSIYRGRLS